MSGFSLRYTQRAVKDIQALDAVAKKRLAKKLLELEVAPIVLSKKLVSSDLGTYRYRVGDYRVIFDIEGKHVVILRVGHRREIYR